MRPSASDRRASKSPVADSGPLTLVPHWKPTDNAAIESFNGGCNLWGEDFSMAGPPHPARRASFRSRSAACSACPSLDAAQIDERPRCPSARSVTRPPTLPTATVILAALIVPAPAIAQGTSTAPAGVLLAYTYARPAFDADRLTTNGSGQEWAAGTVEKP